MNPSSSGTAALPPVLFLAHGSPMAALADDAWSHALSACGRHLARAFPHLSAVIVVSAHWESRKGIAIGSSERPETIYDFGGFPPALYTITYPAPGAPDVARDILASLQAQGLTAQLDPSRGLDHGCWVPLRALFPSAQVPVVPVSLPPRLDTASLSALGTALQALRANGCLIVGSGAIVHNLRAVAPQMEAHHPDDWARDFDLAVRAAVAANHPELLLDGSLPGAALAVPTREHLAPLVVAMAAHGPQDDLIDLFSGFHHKNLSMRSLAFTPDGMSLTGAA